MSSDPFPHSTEPGDDEDRDARPPDGSSVLPEGGAERFGDHDVADGDPAPPNVHRVGEPTPRPEAGRRSSRPVLTWLVLAVCVFLFHASCPQGASQPTETTLIRLGAKVNHLIDEGQFWRLLSSAFLHGAWWHLGLNMFALLCLGLGLESSVGSRRFLCLFVATAVAGSVASYAYSPGLTVGASGAIFGLFGAELISLVRLLPVFHARPPKASCAVLFSLVLGLLFLGFNLVLGLALPELVDNAAHIGGLLAGVFFGLGLPVERPSRAASLHGLALNLAVLACAGALVYTSWSAYAYARTAPEAEIARDVARVRQAVSESLADAPAGIRSERLRRLLPGFAAQAEFRRGVAHHQRGELDQAEAYYRKAIELDPKLKEAYHNLSLILLDRDQDEAVQILLTVIGLDPKAVEAYLNLAQVYTSRGSFALAHEQLARAVEIAPDNADAHRMIARSYDRAGLAEEAEDHYLRSIRLRPSDGPARYYLGLLYVKAADQRSAVQQYRSLRRLDPRLAEMLGRKIEGRFGSID